MLLRVDDQVVVITGASKGHKGKILKVDRDNGKVVVEGAAKVWKHVKRSQKNPQGGRLNKEMPIDASNVMLLDPQTGTRTRVGVRYRDDGSKERYAKSNGASLGQISPGKKRYAKS